MYVESCTYIMANAFISFMLHIFVFVHSFRFVRTFICLPTNSLSSLARKFFYLKVVQRFVFCCSAVQYEHKRSYILFVWYAQFIRLYKISATTTTTTIKITRAAATTAAAAAVQATATPTELK